MFTREMERKGKDWNDHFKTKKQETQQTKEA